mmetsp:Transcript_88463/g.129349  ORF Transcript_88463/g.129349 Transcript_88463/m.129349 type:complete len:83 (-) Transcript_88463:9-257(-)
MNVPGIYLHFSLSLSLSVAQPRSFSLSLILASLSHSRSSSPTISLSLLPPCSHACSIGANRQHRLMVYNFQQRVLLQGSEDP